MGKEAGSFAKEKTADFSKEVYTSTHRTSGILGKIITTIFKIFMYFILGCIALAVIIALFSIAIVAIGLFPLKDFVLTDGWQSVFAWGTLLFFIAVPVIGVITFIIRRFARIKRSNKLIRYSFVGLWVIGIFCFISLITSLGRDFRSINSANIEYIPLSDPKVKSLEVTPFNSNNNRMNNWFKFEPFATFGMDGDTTFVNNIRIRIKKSATDSFHVSEIKWCNGRTRRDADTLAALINFNISQNDSLLMMDRAIAINTTDKFRNQYVEITIAVPVGHYIKVNKNLGWRGHVRFPRFWNDNYWYYNDNDEYFEYRSGVSYIMKDDGLYTLEDIRSDRVNDWNNPSRNHRRNADIQNDHYRYAPNNKIDSLKAEQEKQIQKMQAALDSAKDAREKELNKLKDSLNKAKEEINKKIEKLNNGTAWYDNSSSGFSEKYSFMSYI
jgi:hypothetical protein